jgi:IS6 family transposase
VIEWDHGKLKRIIGATLGFKSMKRLTPPSGIEVMRAYAKFGLSILFGDPLGKCAWSQSF